MAKFGKTAAPAGENSDAGIPQATSVPEPVKSLPSGAVSREQFDSMVEQMAKMQEMILETGDANKIRAFNRRVSKPKGYCFNLGLYPVLSLNGEEREAVILSTRVIKDFVAGAKTTDQRIEISLDDRECPEGETKVEKKVVTLEEFGRNLRRTDKIESKSLQTIDGDPIAKFQDDWGNDKLAVPTKETVIAQFEGKDLSVKIAVPCKATIPYKGKEYTVDLRYLNI